MVTSKQPHNIYHQMISYNFISVISTAIRVLSMASLHTSAPASHSIGALHRPSAGLHASSLIFITPGRHNCQAHLHSKFKKEVRVLLKKSWSALSASNTNPSEGSDDKKTSDAASGPPFLTILAGLVVFLVICWIIGSIATWLIGLIVGPPASK